jgi:hypothetical protein
MRKYSVRKAWIPVASMVPALLVLQLALNAVIDGSWPEVRDPQWAARESRLRRRQAENPDARLVVMLGSSRTELALCGGLLTDESGHAEALVFNLGVPASGPMMELICLRRLMSAGIRPDLLLVEVMPTLLAENSERLAEESKLAYDRLTLAEVRQLAPYCASKSMFVQRACHSRLLVATQRGPELCRALHAGALGGDAGIDAGLEMNDFGWCPPKKSILDTKRAQLTRETCRIYARRFEHFEITPRSTLAFRDLLDTCRKERLPTALVWMPEGSSFRALYSEEAARHVFDFLAEAAGDGAMPVVDARSWVPDAHFFDGHHLLPEGALVFSERLAGECLRPLLAHR